MKNEKMKGEKEQVASLAAIQGGITLQGGAGDMKGGEKNRTFYTILGVLGILALSSLIFCVLHLVSF